MQIAKSFHTSKSTTVAPRATIATTEATPGATAWPFISMTHTNISTFNYLRNYSNINGMYSDKLIYHGRDGFLICEHKNLAIHAG